ncbi:MAG: hypothetical protein J6252_00380 [Clostridia bacterium]|nr:hypothetical protein [Clostridia bacterium]
MKKTALFTRIAAGILFAYLLLHPSEVSASVREGLVFCADVIIPSLFVYMVLSDLLSGVSAVFSGRAFPAAAILCGMLCGSPSGADTVKTLYGKGAINKNQARALIAVSGNASASFIISFAGRAVLGSVRAGAFILAFKFALSLISWCVISHLILNKEERRFDIVPLRESRGLPYALGNAAAAVGSICACVVFFAVLSDLISPLCGSPLFRCVLHGALEFSGGIGECASLGAEIRYVAVCGLIGWQGMCVHLQISLFAGDGIPLDAYFAVKFAECCVMTAFGLLTKGLVI